MEKLNNYIGAKAKKFKNFVVNIKTRFSKQREVFFVKPTPKVKYTSDYMLNPDYKTFSRMTTDAVNDWLDRNTEPVFYGGQDRTVGKTTPTGYNLISDVQ